VVFSRSLRIPVLAYEHILADVHSSNVEFSSSRLRSLLFLFHVLDEVLNISQSLPAWLLLDATGRPC